MAYYKAKQAKAISSRPNSEPCHSRDLCRNVMKPAKSRKQKSPRSVMATRRNPKGFTDQERVAIRERLQELKADARPRRSRDNAARW